MSVRGTQIRAFEALGDIAERLWKAPASADPSALNELQVGTGSRIELHSGRLIPGTELYLGRVDRVFGSWSDAIRGARHNRDAMREDYLVALPEPVHAQAIVEAQDGSFIVGRLTGPRFGTQREPMWLDHQFDGSAAKLPRVTADNAGLRSIIGDPAEIHFGSGADDVIWAPVQRP